MTIRSRTTILLTGVAACLVASPALACGESCPNESSAASPGAAATFARWVPAANAGDEGDVRVEIKDGKVYVWVDDKLKVDGAPAEGRAAMRWESRVGGEGGEWKERSGEPRRARLGVTIRELDEALASQMGIRPSDATMVLSVEEDSAARKAGLRAHDVILRVDGREGGPESLRRVISSAAPGEEIEVVVLRGGEREPMVIELGEARDEPRQDRSMNRFFLQRVEEEDDGQMVFEAPGMQFTWNQEEVQDAVEEAMAGARQAIEQALVEVRQAGGAVRRDLEQELSQSMRQLETQLSELRAKMQAERGAAVAPAAPAAPRAPAAPPARGFRFEGQSGLSERVGSLESRLDRIERLLERLVENR